MWDIASEVYAKTTDIVPTLIFCGTPEELHNEVKSTFGEVYLFPKYPKVIEREDLDWSVTWTAFWAMANLFPSEVCCFSGVDELPLSDILWDKLNTIPEDSYLVGLGSHPYGLSGHVTSGYNIAKGDIFKTVLKIEDDLEEELTRVWNLRFELAKRNFGWNLKDRNWWGMDEAYISSVICDNPKISFLDNKWVSENLQSKKIDRMFNCSYDLKRLQENDYWTAHMVRPLSDPNKRSIILQLLKDMGVR
jgi:hypothetical protein